MSVAMVLSALALAGCLAWLKRGRDVQVGGTDAPARVAAALAGWLPADR
jgi:hypothetical protein